MMTEQDQTKSQLSKLGTDDLYDMDILTDRECPKCDSKLVSHPDLTESCSNSDCDFRSRQSDR